MKTGKLYVLAIAVVAFMVAGQFLAYGANPYHTSSDSWSVYGGIGYEVSSNTSSNYDALLIDTGIYIPDGLMIYEDSSYVSYFDQSYMLETTDLLCSELSLRNVEYTIVDAEQIRAELEEDISNGSADMRLIIPVGVLPDTIYDGGPDSLILKWLETGGVLYWTGYTLGCGISSVSAYALFFAAYGFSKTYRSIKCIIKSFFCIIISINNTDFIRNQTSYLFALFTALLNCFYRNSSKICFIILVNDN